jgi:hypothetical protein
MAEINQINNNNRFKYINNGIDDSLPIIVDTTTGYYNITKIRNIIIKRLATENEAGPNRPGSNYTDEAALNGADANYTDEPGANAPGSFENYKKIRFYFKNKDNIEYVNYICKKYKIKEIRYPLQEGTHC